MVDLNNIGVYDTMMVILAVQLLLQDHLIDKVDQLDYRKITIH